ncbi:CDP-alcohol phosphatidyltransferase family protein [Knoellia sp. CPCC 206435]|uniref:CDP-alcohol phosphatidyltransferase family protein n=1 Tax=Knoellia terrae TaxID=3404797 RepID=UPI003B43269E
MSRTSVLPGDLSSASSRSATASLAGSVPATVRLSAAGAVPVGMTGLVALLAVLAVLVDIGALGWVVGLGCGGVLVGLLTLALARDGRDALGPADTITLGRGLMACAVATLTVESLLGQHVSPALVGLAVPALALDAVDGVVARRTGTVSAVGARFDGEVDAFLILVLSAAVAPSVGWWVLAGGLARYAFGLAGWVLPWMRGSLAFRYWRKVVTATVGVVLAIAAAGVLPGWLTVTTLAGAHVLLAESFGRDVRSLWARRDRTERGAAASRRHPARRRRWVRVLTTTAVTSLVVAILWFALVAPNQLDRFSAVGFIRLPVEVAAVAATVIVVPARWRRTVTVILGSVLGAITLLKVLDLAAFAVLSRPFDVVTDRGLLGSGLAFVRDSWGPWVAAAVVVTTLLVAVGAVVGPAWALSRLARAVTRNRSRGAQAVLVLTSVWVLCAVSGAQVVAGVPVALSGAGPFVAGKVEAGVTAYRDRERFVREMKVDAFRSPASADLAGLAGKDVVVVFVESYGRVALEGTGSEPVRALLDAGADRLGSVGVEARSGYLTSSTFGGSSWLAHSTFQSGLSVSDQVRYDLLLATDRTTLSSAFSRQGWRTVAVLPSTHGNWPEGQAFYGFDQVYGRGDLGYAGPTFGFSAVPDQFALSALARLELGSGRAEPVMAEVELTSSHGPWAPVPTMVDDAALGDGSVFRSVHREAVTSAELWGDRASVPAAYRASIEYSLASVLSFVEQRADDDLVVVVLGDHQPATIVSGFGGNRDVPISVIARDPRVLDQVSAWGWTDGLRPGEGAPVWPMADFRDRFLGAFSSTPSLVASGARP